MTILFLDLVGFTTLTAERGDEHAADAAWALYSCVRALLPTHRAREVKTIGDAMMLCAPDPSGAIALAVSIVAAVKTQATLPAVRVGVHTGPAVQREGDWYGSTVNVAARLCAAAGGGEVLVSESARRAAGHLGGVQFAEPRLHWLKNVTEPVTARVASASLGAPSASRARAGGRASATSTWAGALARTQRWLYAARSMGCSPPALLDQGGLT